MKYALSLALLFLAAGGLAAWIVADNLLLGLGMTALALVLWAGAPSVLGRVGSEAASAAGIDPRQVREYRSSHPGATIADGIRATDPSR
ncbi:hypothetical protein QNO08_14715 [Arthrobacter sp. zg-Y820]|uniref:hypothetical protein n=1 Tax=unclassified Arthrobacter TaxID=235627 RepID=UPI001E3A0882|nr:MULTISPECIES: hypothetical protein [unclassified Arthrobacter]MCC9195639.1 hypothetical protein [Arthrobacter sp. zg-Y820]MDK1278498.1 hypothetical protein [Arthrobacter sp. zg.Y820]WIB09066.1 hypothetical protein QNO08_14715 [Arthrobacter sp. zg-Y820]